MLLFQTNKLFTSACLIEMLFFNLVPFTPHYFTPHYTLWSSLLCCGLLCSAFLWCYLISLEWESKMFRAKSMLCTLLCGLLWSAFLWTDLLWSAFLWTDLLWPELLWPALLFSPMTYCTLFHCVSLCLLALWRKCCNLFARAVASRWRDLYIAFYSPRLWRYGC